MPKKYHAKHKEFKRYAWKIKLIHGVQSQVIFDEYKLILRYKRKDEGVNKFNYVIEKEWYPQPGEIETSRQQSSINDPSKLATPVIDTSSVAECHSMAIVQEYVTRSIIRMQTQNLSESLITRIKH